MTELKLCPICYGTPVTVVCLNENTVQIKLRCIGCGLEMPTDPIYDGEPYDALEEALAVAIRKWNRGRR